MASREFTTVEYHTNESSFGKIGYVETVTTNREIVANHLAYTHLYMFLVAEQPVRTDEFKGCAFHTRCPYATDKCRSEAPKLREVTIGHKVACHYDVKG